MNPTLGVYLETWGLSPEFKSRHFLFLLFKMSLKDKRKENQTIKTQINITDFAESRAFEIKAMESSLSFSTEFHGAKRIFQRIKRHMRRRAASHNPKRLPSRYRQRAIQQLLSDPNNSKKFLNRSKRRRPKYHDFLKRQVDKRWLETHVWHAKRSRMAQMFGFMLSIRSNDKSYRAAFRASKYHALIHDASYMRCFQFSGSRINICEYFSTLLDPLVAGVKSNRFINGDRVGHGILYNPSSWPRNPICPFDFIWKQDSSDQDAVLWVFLHPCAFKEASNVFLTENLDGLFILI